MTANKVQSCFCRFRLGIFLLKDASYIGRPVIVNIITEIIEVNQHVSGHGISQDRPYNGFPSGKSWLNGMKSTHLFNRWWRRMRNASHSINMVWKRSWSKCSEAAQMVVEPGLTPRKVLLCIWWHWKILIYYVLLLHGQTLNSDLYCQQQDHSKLTIYQKRPELANRWVVVFHQDSATPLTPIMKLWHLGWEALMHQPYHLDLATSFYHLFLHYKTYLMLWNRHQEKIVKINYKFFANKDQDYYARRYKASLKMARNCKTKRFTFYSNRTIRSILNKSLKFT